MASSLPTISGLGQILCTSDRLFFLSTMLTHRRSFSTSFHLVNAYSFLLQANLPFPSLTLLSKSNVPTIYSFSWHRILHFIEVTIVAIYIYSWNYLINVCLFHQTVSAIKSKKEVSFSLFSHYYIPSAWYNFQPANR